jgi:hypothetical protein
MATWDDVKAIAGALEDVEETTTYRMPCFKTGGKLFLNMSPHEPGALAVRVPVELQPVLVAKRPGLFFVTPHYQGYGAVLLRLETVKKKDLAEAIRNSYTHVRSGLRRRPARAARK